MITLIMGSNRGSLTISGRIERRFVDGLEDAADERICVPGLVNPDVINLEGIMEMITDLTFVVAHVILVMFLSQKYRLLQSCLFCRGNL